MRAVSIAAATFRRGKTTVRYLRKACLSDIAAERRRGTGRITSRVGLRRKVDAYLSILGECRGGKRGQRQNDRGGVDERKDTTTGPPMKGIRVNGEDTMER